jgi:hypothetical protein
MWQSQLFSLKIWRVWAILSRNILCTSGSPFLFATKFQKFAKKIIAEILDLYPVKKKLAFFWQISYLCKKWDFFLQVARFVSWRFHYMAHIIKGCLILFLYLIYNQILLNLLIGQSQLWLHHKNWNLKTPPIPDFKAKLKVCLEFQAYWW